jgi:hypothetical protein
MGSYFHNKQYNFSFIQNELDYIMDNKEVSDEFKQHVNSTIELLEDAFNRVEDIDQVMTYRITEQQFLDKYKKVRI